MDYEKGNEMIISIFGEAWWNDGNVKKYKFVFSADNDA
jgi:hypothetical protein